jgi:hypothetical protein
MHTCCYAMFLAEVELGTRLKWSHAVVLNLSETVAQ